MAQYFATVRWLFFLSIAAQRGFLVDRYIDRAVGEGLNCLKQATLPEEMCAAGAGADSSCTATARACFQADATSARLDNGPASSAVLALRPALLRIR